MNGDSARELILRHSRPLTPIATDAASRLQSLPGIRCVLFDVYGTLLVSGSGEVGTLLPDAEGDAFRESLAAVGVAVALPPEAAGARSDGSLTEERGRKALTAAVAASHARDRADGVEYPEVDIVDIWRDCLAQLADEGLLPPPTGSDWGTLDFEQLALEYELRTNPVWPMPGAETCLASMRQRGILTGLISNAQFFTPRILAALMPAAFSDLDSSNDVQYYSYRHRQAKPGLALYELAVQDLADRGISPHEVLYVGNDMLNDMWPASQVGFRTALFAGDRRSLRWREGDSRVADLKADVVVSELASLIECVGGDSR